MSQLIICVKFNKTQQQLHEYTATKQCLCLISVQYLWPPYVIGHAIIFLSSGFFSLSSIYLSVRDGRSFAKRIVNTWNSLPDSVVLSKSVATFRHKVNKMHFSDYCGL